MKIAIIANGFSGATLPLAKHLYEKKHHIDCFYIVSMGATCIESIDFSSPIPYHFAPIGLEKSNKLFSYLPSKVQVNLLPVFRKMVRLERIGIGRALPIVNRLLIKHYLDDLQLEKYDIINVIVHTELEVLICKELKKKKIPFVITYHEVFKQLTGKLSLKDEVKNTLCLNTPIILHSDNVKKELLNWGKIEAGRVRMIHFGAFESYSSYGDVNSIHPGVDDYFLYLGHIKPYKGLGVLYEASLLCKESIQFVVAGGGYDETITKMLSSKNFVIYNRFMSNDEVVSLIRKCKALVLPYLSASQSGLVQTAMVFNKPIIASAVGAFPEIVQNDKNGLLVPAGDSDSLAKAINEFEHFQFEPVYSREYDWGHICEQYVELFNSIINENS